MLDDQAHPNAPEHLAAGIQEANARQRLRAFLAEAHQTMPDLSEDEVGQDIRNTIAAIRSHS